MSEKRCRVVVITVGVILVVSLTLFIVGLVFVLNKCDNNSQETLSDSLDLCKPSEEANKSGLIDLLANVRQNSNKVCPCTLPLSKNNLAPPREHLKPTTIKDTTDKARSLFKQLKSLTIDESKLTPRELRSLAEVEHFLSHNFGEPESDYYSGLWLLGPDVMCRSGYMCRWFPQHVSSLAYIVSPLNSLDDILEIPKALGYFNKTIYQYMDNMRYGAQSGMVRSIEACVAGFDAIKTKYVKVAELNATGRHKLTLFLMVRLC